jgi:hypothetical protein
MTIILQLLPSFLAIGEMESIDPSRQSPRHFPYRNVTRTLATDLSTSISRTPRNNVLRKKYRALVEHTQQSNDYRLQGSRDER